MHSMCSFPAALIPLVHLFLPQLLHVIMDALIVSCTEEEVCELLKSLDITKVNGPDRISARNQQPMQLLHHLQNYSTAPLHVAVLQPAGLYWIRSPYHHMDS